MSFIRKAIESVDGSGEVLQERREAISRLYDLGQSKADNFKLQIQESLMSAGSIDNRTIPIESVVRKTAHVRAFNSSEASGMKEAIGSILNVFMGGTSDTAKNAVTSGMNFAIDSLIGSSSASSGYTEEYYVAVEGLSVIRVDMMAWYQNVEAASIKKVMEKLLVVVAVKSVVDISKVKFSTFLNLYQSQLAIGGGSKEAMIEEILFAKRVFKEYKLDLIDGDDYSHSPQVMMSQSGYDTQYEVAPQELQLKSMLAQAYAIPDSSEEQLLEDTLPSESDLEKKSRK